MKQNDYTKTKVSATAPTRAARVLGWLFDAVKAAPAEERIAHAMVVAGMAVALYRLDRDPTDWMPMALIALCVLTEAAVVFMRRRMSQDDE